MSESKIIKKTDEDGEEYFLKEISINLIFNTYNEIVIEENIETMILEALDDIFDGLGWFEKNDVDDVIQYFVAFVYVCNLDFVWKNLYTTEEN